MASITSIPSNIFFGNPLVVSAVSGTKPSAASFHRVMLNVTVTGGSGNPYQVTLSQPSSYNGCTVDFDISSCVRTVHDAYEYAPITNNINYPVYSVSVIAYDEWVINGDSIAGPDQDSRSSLRFIAGRYTDYERISGAALPQTHTRKPLTGELVCPTDRIVYTVSEGLSPRSQTHNVLATTQPGPLEIGNRTYYVVPQDKRSRQFQFVNSRGVIESIRAFSLPAEKMSVTSKESTYSVFERLRQLSRTFVCKQSKPMTLQLSSGAVNYEWARWWAYEFCAASQHWMLNEGRWIPVHISIADSTTIIDRTKTELLHVDFDVKPDLNGPLW